MYKFLRIMCFNYRASWSPCMIDHKNIIGRVSKHTYVGQELYIKNHKNMTVNDEFSLLITIICYMNDNCYSDVEQ